MTVLTRSQMGQHARAVLADARAALASHHEHKAVRGMCQCDRPLSAIIGDGHQVCSVAYNWHCHAQHWLKQLALAERTMALPTLSPAVDAQQQPNITKKPWWQRLLWAPKTSQGGA